MYIGLGTCTGTYRHQVSPLSTIKLLDQTTLNIVKIRQKLTKIMLNCQKLQDKMDLAIIIKYLSDEENKYNWISNMKQNEVPQDYFNKMERESATQHHHPNTPIGSKMGQHQKQVRFSIPSSSSIANEEVTSSLLLKNVNFKARQVISKYNLYENEREMRKTVSSGMVCSTCEQYREIIENLVGFFQQKELISEGGMETIDQITTAAQQLKTSYLQLQKKTSAKFSQLTERISEVKPSNSQIIDKLKQQNYQFKLQNHVLKTHIENMKVVMSQLSITSKQRQSKSKGKQLLDKINMTKSVCISPRTNQNQLSRSAFSKCTDEIIILKRE